MSSPYYYPHEQHAGYYYNWIAPLQQWGLKWQPIQDTYSPPQLDSSLQWIHLSVPEGVNIIPLLGDGRMHCEKLAGKIGATYLYYRHDLHKIEIWAQDITGAMTNLSVYLNGLRRVETSKKRLVPSLK